MHQAVTLLWRSGFFYPLMTLKYSLTFLLAFASIGLSPAWADILVLNPSDDSYIRAIQGNQGSNDLAIVGDTATPEDYLRAAFAFDLSAPELEGATIDSVTLTLTVDGRDTSSGGSADATSLIDLHELLASFTNSGVTWTSRDGTNDWTTPGGDFGASLASLSANAGTVSAGAKLNFSSGDLRSVTQNALDGSGALYLLTKLRTEDADRSVFRLASQDNSTASQRPVLTIDFHTAFFSVDDPVMVEVEFLNGVSYASIHPLRHGIQPVEIKRTPIF